MTARVGSLAPRVDASREEWEVRVDLAAAYRLVALYGWSDLIFTHISARVPGPEHHFLINPYGMLFEEITASSLVKIDLAGNKHSDSPYDVNPAGFVIHSAIHAVRNDARCVLHTHTAHGVAVAAQKAGLLPLSQQAAVALLTLSYHDYEGIAVNDAEKARLQLDIGRSNILILRNHGLLTVGATPADAFLSMYNLENACRIQILAQSGGSELSLVLAAVGEQSIAVMKGQGAGLVWPALLRKLDRLDPSFRT